MSVVMEGNMRTGIRINARSGNNRSAEIAANILGDDRGIAVVGFGVDIEALAMILINSRFNVFERSAEFRVETIEKSSAEGLAKESVIKMLETLPSGNTPDSDFGNKDVDMRIPLKTAAEGMKNTDETGSKRLSLVDFAEHMKDDVANGMKKAVEKRAISAKENTEFFGDGKNTMPMNALNDLEGHGSSALDRIKVSTGRTKTGFTAERDEFESATRRTPIHSATEGRVSAMNHFFNALHDNRASFEGVLDFFIMVRKNLLQNVHSTIIQQESEKAHPLMNEGAGGADAA